MKGEKRMDNNVTVFTKEDVKTLASHMTSDLMTDYFEFKSQILAIKAYINSDKYFTREVIKRILGMEVTEDDD